MYNYSTYNAYKYYLNRIQDEEIPTNDSVPSNTSKELSAYEHKAPSSRFVPQRTSPLHHGQHSKQITVPPPRNLADEEDCVTIIFHALLSPDFNFEPNKQEVNVRLGYEELGNFEWNCVSKFDTR